MNLNEVYCKTNEGMTALRESDLLKRKELRTAFAVIDGRTKVSHLVQQWKHRGCTESAFRALWEAHLIATRQELLDFETTNA